MKSFLPIFRFGFILTTLIFCGCSFNKSEDIATKGNVKMSNIGSFITNAVVKNQLAMPQKGEQIVVFHVKDYGEIKCRLFPQAAPNSVAKFKEAVKAKKYDGALFYRVVEDFVVQGGTEYKEKDENESQKYQIELNKTLHHFNGALCMARGESRTKGQGTDFYFVSSEYGKKVDFEVIKNQINSVYKKDGLNISVDFNKETKKTYREKGGRPDLDMVYTIFGQIFQGQEVVKKIEMVPKDTSKVKEGSNEPGSFPKEPVIIEKVELVTV